MRRSFHYILLAITIGLALISGILMMHVNVNADMTKYLPDDSQMKRGLEIVFEEFGSAAQMSGTDVHVMFEGVRPKEIPGIRTLLEAYPDVQGVTYRYSADSTYTLFDLDVPKSVDQKALGKQISNRFGGSCVVETSQDGATPPMSVMVIYALAALSVRTKRTSAGSLTDVGAAERSVLPMMARAALTADGPVPRDIMTSTIFSVRLSS